MPCLEFRRVLFRSEEHTSELQSHSQLVCRLLLEKKTNGPVRAPGATAGASTASIGGSAAGGGLSVRPGLRAAGSRRPTCLRRGRRSFFFNVRGPAGIYPLSPHAALPI